VFFFFLIPKIDVLHWFQARQLVNKNELQLVPKLKL